MTSHPSPLLDLWYVFTEKAGDERLLSRYRAILPVEEREKELRFRLARMRLEYVVTRALVRTVLSHYVDLPPEAWRFRMNAHGKPFVTDAVDGLPKGSLQFNLSHTRGLVVCGVTFGREVGVDTESFGRVSNHDQLARRFFAPSEADFLEAMPDSQRSATFLRFWTLKEAFIKSRGMGLSIPLDEFAFSISPDQAAQIEFTRKDWGKPDDWQFFQFQFAERYPISAAMPISVNEPVDVRLIETVPLEWQSEKRVLPPSTVRQWTI